MIKPDAKLSIRLLSLEDIQVKECQERYLARLEHYMALMHDHPDEYAGILAVTPSHTHPGMYTLLDGHTRFCASIMTGRLGALCVIVEDA